MADRRFIDATSLKVAVTRYCEVKARHTRRKALRNCISELCYDFCLAVDDAPSSDVRENVHGRWITDGGHRSFGRIRASCSRCGAFALYEFVNVGSYKEALSMFCPNCGLDMREKAE